MNMWILTEISNEEQTQKTARITAWRQRLRSSSHHTWRWLGRYKLGSMLTYTMAPDGQINSGDHLVHQIHNYWSNIWPTAQPDTDVLQQLAATAPWPDIPAPQLEPFTAENIRSTARRLHGKAPGPDTWKGYEIAFAPQQALEYAAAIFNAIENGAPWPNSLTHWRQLHFYKPGKPEGLISSTRPISIGSLWYRLWASHRIKSLQQWIITVMPQQQHGCLKKKSTHTALIPPLAAVETSLAQPHNNNTISYVGATDLSKAFDKMAWKHSIAALSRMGLPRRILTPLANAWENQQRWLTTANHIGTQPVSAQCLPQGDPASPLALMAPLSEALQRILHAHPDAQFGRQIHSLYMDDRCWFCTRASTCISIAKCWRQETALLQLGENNSKADFSFFGSKRLIQPLQDALHTADIPGTISNRIRILGTFTQCNRQHSGPNADETARIKQAEQVLRWAKILPHTHAEKAVFAKATALAIAATPAFSRIPAIKELNTLSKAMTHIASNGSSGPLARLLCGHAADPVFRTGYIVTIHTLKATANDPLLRNAWPTKQTQGSIAIIKRWLQRHGWSCNAPWTWIHDESRTAFTLTNAVLPQDHIQMTLDSFKADLLAHHLRTAWRANRWRNFLSSPTKAAAALQHYTWHQVAPRAKHTLKAWHEAEPRLRPHMMTINTGHYVSQARLQHTQSLAVTQCIFCGSSTPHRVHEWWECPTLNTQGLQPGDTLEAWLGWPTQANNFTKLQHLADTRLRILHSRYPPQVDME